MFRVFRDPPAFPCLNRAIINHTNETTDAQIHPNAALNSAPHISITTDIRQCLGDGVPLRKSSIINAATDNLKNQISTLCGHLMSSQVHFECLWISPHAQAQGKHFLQFL